jgi:hypothetical protein
LQIKTKIISFRTSDSKPVKREINSTVILPPLVFPALPRPPLPFISPSDRGIWNQTLNLIILSQWKRISSKQSARLQHLSQLKASTFFSLQKYSCKETQQLILGISNAICWVIEPYGSTTVHPPLDKVIPVSLNQEILTEGKTQYK